MSQGQGFQRAGFIALWILGCIAQQVKRDAHAGWVSTKALWRTWVSTYWPRIPRPVRVPLFAVGATARGLYRAGFHTGRTIRIGVQNGVEEGGHRHREFLELRQYPKGSQEHSLRAGRIARDRLERADVYRMRAEQIHGEAIRYREERNLWAKAATLAELGEVTAQWAEGKIKFHPNGYDEGPDPETVGLIPALVVLNRSGFVTSCSQPGHGPTWGFDNRVWWQRAAVDGYTDPETAARLEKACTAAGLIFIRNGRAGWRTHWRNSVIVTASPVEGTEITEDSRYCAHTGFGTHMSRHAVKFDFDGYGAEALLNAEQVTIIDPQWGRNDLLWSTIAGHTPPRAEVRYTADVYNPGGHLHQRHANLTFDELGLLFDAFNGTGWEVEIVEGTDIELPNEHSDPNHPTVEPPAIANTGPAHPGDPTEDGHWQVNFPGGARQTGYTREYAEQLAAWARWQENALPGDVTVTPMPEHLDEFRNQDGDLHFGGDPEDPNGIGECSECGGTAATNHDICPSCRARGAIRNADHNRRRPEFAPKNMRKNRSNMTPCCPCRNELNGSAS